MRRGILSTLLLGTALSAGCLYRPVSAPIGVPTEEIKDEAIKEKVQLIENVKRFTVEELGMHNTNHYTKYLPGELTEDATKYTMYVTCDDTLRDSRFPRFQIYTDREIPEPFGCYSVYESKVDNFEDEKKRFTEQGYNVHVFATTQFTTAVRTSQITDTLLEESDAELASTVCHEQIHAALPGLWSIPMHEAIAGFFDNVCAYHYFLKYEGEKSTNAEEALDNFAEHWLLSESLPKAYNDIQKVLKNKSLSAEEKQQMQNDIFEELKDTTGKRFNNASLAKKAPYYLYAQELFDLYQAQDTNLYSTMKTLQGCSPSRKGCLSFIQRETKRLEEMHAKSK